MKLQKKINIHYKFFIIICFIFLIFGIILNTPKEIFQGLIIILNIENVLIMDYIEVSNFGSALFNVAFVGLSLVFVLHFSNSKPNGDIIGGLWMGLGFAFFGKNFYNIWPVLLGIYLYAKYQKKPFSNFAVVGTLSSGIVPVVTYFSHHIVSNNILGSIIGFIIGIFVGFIMPTLVVSTKKLYGDYTLYNTGFACGLIAIFFICLSRIFGFNTASQDIWSTTSSIEGSILVIIISLVLIGYGIFKDKNVFIEKLKQIYSKPEKIYPDYFLDYENSNYINMGLLGLFCLIIMLVLKIDINGPSIGALFSVVGFGACGKTIKNITPLFLGATLASLIASKGQPISHGHILGIFFASNLSPFVNEFGFLAGIIAGFVHLSISGNTGYLQGGLNLYNNGLAGGLTATILVAIFKSFKKETYN